MTVVLGRKVDSTASNTEGDKRALAPQSEQIIYEKVIWKLEEKEKDETAL